jgi:putative ABC transport system ATP-binding protein
MSVPGSGSGKSTLLNLITGIDHPTTGEIVVDGDPLTGRSENALARWRGRHAGIIFQFFHLIPTLTTFEPGGGPQPHGRADPEPPPGSP